MFLQNKGWNKILSNLSTAAPGTRAWPNRTKDREVSFRVDYGPLYTGSDGLRYRNLELQPNRGTRDRNVAALASADSHQVLATVPVSVDHPPSASEFANQLGQLLG